MGTVRNIWVYQSYNTYEKILKNNMWAGWEPWQRQWCIGNSHVPPQCWFSASARRLFRRLRFRRPSCAPTHSGKLPLTVQRLQWSPPRLVAISTGLWDYGTFPACLPLHHLLHMQAAVWYCRWLWLHRYRWRWRTKREVSHACTGTPSYRLSKPSGSRLERMPAGARALLTMSLRAAWRGSLPVLYRHDSGWRPRVSTIVPHR